MLWLVSLRHAERAILRSTRCRAGIWRDEALTLRMTCATVSRTRADIARNIIGRGNLAYSSCGAQNAENGGRRHHALKRFLARLGESAKCSRIIEKRNNPLLARRKLEMAHLLLRETSEKSRWLWPSWRDDERELVR